MAPADGERNAVIGIVGQYEFAALRTYNALRDGHLVSIRLADVRAGQIDDFQLRTLVRTDAYQVKWSLNAGTCGYAEFARDTASRTSAIRQLADGWQRLTALHRPTRVVVHWVTNDLPSSRASQEIPRSTAAHAAFVSPRSWSFARFLDEAWRPSVQAARQEADTDAAVPFSWKAAMAALREKSGLTADMWPRFLADCELEFGVPSLDVALDIAAVRDGEERLLHKDVDRLTYAFLQFVRQPNQQIEFTRAQLLDELGWRFRVDLRGTHDFPDPEIPYRRIALTAQAIARSLEQFSNGYISLTGSPGSGKSTLLTRLLRDSSHQSVRYYAYVPDAVGVASRGEAVDFYHDLTVALERAGFSGGATLPDDDLHILVARVQTQLSQASDRYRKTEKRLLILVDGLDHIVREQQPTHSLLAHLPLPDVIPEGILFLLGTQTDRLPGLSARIRAHLDEPGRRIVMLPLERGDVLEIVEGATDISPPPSAAERQRIADLSGGHPLALNYILNRLRHANGAAVATTLDAVETFAGAIDDQYAALWAKFEDDAELVRLLGVLARVRGPVRLGWVRHWAPIQTLHLLTTQFSHLFRQGRGERWSFFHNSFRVFAVERTKSVPALGDDKACYHQLAEYCANADDREPEQGDELYYRARAGEFENAVSLCDPGRIREQFVKGRSPTTIRDDLGFAFDAAIEMRNIQAVTRILLLRAEFLQREYYTKKLPLAEVWLDLGDVDLALDFLRSRGALRVSRTSALRASDALSQSNFAAEAREVFLLAEPLDVLRGVAEKNSGRDREVDLLDAWIAAAPHFRPLSVIVPMIENLKARADDFRRHSDQDRTSADEEEAEARRLRLFRGLANTLDRLARWDDADTVLEILGRRDTEGKWWFWAQTWAWQNALADGDRTRAESRFSVLLRVLESGVLSELFLERNERVAMATGHVRLRNDSAAALRLLSHVQQPPPATDLTYSYEDRWQPFSSRFTLNRLLGALGDRRPLGEIVPGQPSRPGRHGDRDQGSRLLIEFERQVAQLGRLTGRNWTGHELSLSEFELHARKFIELFPDDVHRMRGVYPATEAREGFYARLIDLAAKMGEQYIAILQRLFAHEWESPSRQPVWPNSLIRSILIELHAAGAPPEWVQPWLGYIEPQTFRGDDLETDLAGGTSQTRAWLKVGNIVAARTTLDRVLRATFGNEAKDYGLTACLQWARLANREDPRQAPGRLTQMASAVGSLDDGKVQLHVVRELIEAGVESGAEIGASLVNWALQNGIYDWPQAMATLIEQLVTFAPAAAGTLSAAYRTLVLPFATSADTDLVARLGSTLRAEHAACDREEPEALLGAINVTALASLRAGLRQAAAGHAEEAREMKRDKGVGDPTAPDQVVDAFDGLSLTLRQLQSRVRSVGDVEDLAQRLKPGAYAHRWELILAPFLELASMDELVATAAAIPQDEHAWRVLAAIVERLLAKDDFRAGKIAERVAEASRGWGWAEYFDGGSRLTAYELLTRLSPAQGTRRAWRALRDDLFTGEVSPRDLFGGWDRIVRMLAPETSAVGIWEVVSKHVAALTAYARHTESVELPSAANPADSEAAADTVFALAARYLDHPAHALALGAQQFYTDRLLAKDPVAERAMRRRLVEIESPKGGALLVLRAVACGGGPVPTSLHDVLKSLQNAPSYRDRRTVAALLGSTWKEGREMPTIQRPLPTVFQIIHPRAKTRRQRPLLGRGALLPPAEDVADLVWLFRGELDLLAELADIQPEALYQFVATRAIELLPEGSRDMGCADELLLREEMEHLGLRVAYRRPRHLRVERAMAEAAAMLIDHGRIASRHLVALDLLFRNDDPYFLLRRTGIRPSDILPIPERQTSRDVGQDWTQNVSTTAALAGRIVLRTDVAGTKQDEDRSDEWIILAEETWLCWLVWEQATEMRVGARIPARERILDKRDEGSTSDEQAHIDIETATRSALSARLGAFSHLTASEYLRRARDPKAIVVRNETYRFGTPLNGWLALNPMLAEQLGWRLSPNGFFRWLDKNGETVAESLWWQDGFSQQHPPRFEDEVGYGWLVRATVAGWRKIEAAVGACVDWRRVSRVAENQPGFVRSESKPVEANVEEDD